ncbi:hypothetical protein [Streptomyces sp. 5-10]|uniref:hypothetical protein n=1 Tax=Streptomyces sp. 5-10 TaxID=878925 RepID=UPI00168B0D1C|nr:hypothetical protein [Streptomyces sp. 5-10]MBD3004824.1 hypothetical protein [Streptomyces sp. 5-10]
MTKKIGRPRIGSRQEFRFPDDLLGALKGIAGKEGVTLNSTVRRLLYSHPELSSALHQRRPSTDQTTSTL